MAVLEFFMALFVLGVMILAIPPLAVFSYKCYKDLKDELLQRV